MIEPATTPLARRFYDRFAHDHNRLLVVGSL
jgi:hypothetical protein